MQPTSQTDYTAVGAGGSSPGDLEMAEEGITIAPRIDISMRHAESFHIAAKRRISSSTNIGARNANDEVITLARRSSAKDTITATARRVSSSSLPTGLGSVLEVSRKMTKVEIKQELEKQAAPMKYTEHLFAMYKLSDFYKNDINEEKISASRGLTKEKAAFLLKELGPNVLTPPPKVPLWLLFLMQFSNFFMMLLIAAGILCFVAFALTPSDLTNMYLGVLLFIVIFVTSYETFSQEAKSDQLMEKFRVRRFVLHSSLYILTKVFSIDAVGNDSFGGECYPRLHHAGDQGRRSCYRRHYLP